MSRLHSTSNVNTEPIEEVTELIDASSIFLQNNQTQGSDSPNETKINVLFMQNLSSKDKDFRNQNENMDATNQFYSYSSLRFPKMDETLEEQVEMIAHHIDRKSKTKQNHSASEIMRSEMIKNMPQNLTLKRAIKAKLETSTDHKLKNRHINFCKRIDYQLSITMSKFKITLKQLGSGMKFWRNSIKTIEGHFGSGIASYFKFLRGLLLMNTIVFVFSNLFITLPQLIKNPYENGTFSSWNLLLGNGLFTNSIMYYGYYVNHTLVLGSQFSYDMPAAYFLTFLFCYFLICILLCFKVARSYKKCYIETSGGAYNRYANKIFCTWDWGISSYKAATLRSASIYRELEELLWETKISTEPVSFSMKIWTLLIRFSMTTLIFSTLCGTGALLWLLLNEYKTDESNVLSIMTMPSIMTIIINLVPPLISWSVKYENYAKDRIAFYVTMVRVYVIAVVAVATLLTFWLTQGMHDGCWQTKLAQEIYRLILLDFFFSIFGIFFIQYVRSLGFLRRRFGSPTFDITRNTLNLIYNQTLFWIAHYFSPPLSLVIMIKLIITFYVKKYELMKFSAPPSKFWRAAQMQTLFLALTFFGMITAMGILTYVFIYVNTNNCGPFTGHDYTWEFIAERVFHVRKDSLFWNVLEQIIHPATGIFLLIVMSFAVYYLRAKAEASKQMVKILREMLVWQARDKEFLVKSFKTASEKNLLRRRRLSEIAATEANVRTRVSRQVQHDPSTSQDE